MKTISEYNIYCTSEQTKKALELGAPIDICNERITNIPPRVWIEDRHEWYKLPTAEQMIGWLEEQGIMFDIIQCVYVNVWKDSEVRCIDRTEKYSRKESTLAAIDAALEYLSDKK